MSGENQGENTVQTPEAPPEDTTTNEIEENIGFDPDPLFDSESVTEAELMGEEPKPEDATGKDAANPEPEGDDKEETEKPKEPEKEPEEEPKAEPDYSNPPPKGFVPLPALQEERNQNQTLRAEVARLNSELDAAKAGTQAKEDPFKDFKMLSDEEFDELLDDDPDDATRYQHKLVKYQLHRSKIRRQEHLQNDAEAKDKEVIRQGYERAIAAVPGVFDENSEAAGQLVETAVNHGIEESFLSAITNPSTRLTVQTEDGKKVSFLAGHGAASVIDMLNRMRTSLAKTNPETLRSQIKTEMEAALRKEITAELMDKFRTGQDGFRSLDEAPASGDQPAKFSKVMNEAEYAKLSPEQQEQYLSGTL